MGMNATVNLAKFWEHDAAGEAQERGKQFLVNSFLFSPATVRFKPLPVCCVQPTGHTTLNQH